MLLFRWLDSIGFDGFSSGDLVICGNYPLHKSIVRNGLNCNDVWSSEVFADRFEIENLSFRSYNRPVVERIISK